MPLRCACEASPESRRLKPRLDCIMIYGSLSHCETSQPCLIDPPHPSANSFVLPPTILSIETSHATTIFRRAYVVLDFFFFSRTFPLLCNELRFRPRSEIVFWPAADRGGLSARGIRPGEARSIDFSRARVAARSKMASRRVETQPGLASATDGYI